MRRMLGEALIRLGHRLLRGEAPVFSQKDVHRLACEIGRLRQDHDRLAQHTGAALRQLPLDLRVQVRKDMRASRMRGEA